MNVGRWLARGLPLALGALIVADSGMLVWISRASPSSSVILIARAGAPAGPIQQPIGLNPDLRPIALPRTKCWVGRFESRECGFCRADDGVWGRLALDLERLRCPTVILLPTATEGFPKFQVVPSGAPQEAYVTLDLAQRIRLTTLPTTFIVGRGGKVIWRRVGELQPPDFEAALRAADRALGRVRGVPR